jgi:hypothetical protein
MLKQFLIAFPIAIGIGFVLLNPYAVVYFYFFLLFATVIGLVIIIHSVFNKTSLWKPTLLWLAVGYTIAITSYCVQNFKHSQFRKERNKIITALYHHRSETGKFPSALTEVSDDNSFLRANYYPDPALQNFVLRLKDFYGFPWAFSSKDSSWGR